MVLMGWFGMEWYTDYYIEDAMRKVCKFKKHYECINDTHSKSIFSYSRLKSQNNLQLDKTYCSYKKENYKNTKRYFKKSGKWRNFLLLNNEKLKNPE